MMEQCPGCLKPIGPLKLKKTRATSSEFTQFQVSKAHKHCFGPDRQKGFRPGAQFKPDKNGECRTTLSKVTAGKDGKEIKYEISVTLKRA